MRLGRGTRSNGGSGRAGRRRYGCGRFLGRGSWGRRQRLGMCTGLVVHRDWRGGLFFGVLRGRKERDLG